MAPPDSPPSVSRPDVLGYTCFSEIFRSWFWRLYDHLLRLLFYNFGWALSCLGVGWLTVHAGWADFSKPLNPIRLFQIYGLYLLESTTSVGWAYGVFRIFIEGKTEWVDLWIGTRKYLLKAVGISGVSALLTGCGFYSLHFYFFMIQTHRFLALFLAAISLWILLLWWCTCLYQWPVLFFQNPPFHKIFYKSFLLVMGNGLVSAGIMVLSVVYLGLLLAAPFLVFFLGLVLFFAFQCVALEKNLLKYKITFNDQPLGPFLEQLEAERKRSWREFLKPWGDR